MATAGPQSNSLVQPAIEAGAVGNLAPARKVVEHARDAADYAVELIARLVLAARSLIEFEQHLVSDTDREAVLSDYRTRVQDALGRVVAFRDLLGRALCDDVLRAIELGNWNWDTKIQIAGATYPTAHAAVLAIVSDASLFAEAESAAPFGDGFAFVEVVRDLMRGAVDDTGEFPTDRLYPDDHCAGIYHLAKQADVVRAALNHEWRRAWAGLQDPTREPPTTWTRSTPASPAEWAERLSMKWPTIKGLHLSGKLRGEMVTRKNWVFALEDLRLYGWTQPDAS